MPREGIRAFSTVFHACSGCAKLVQTLRYNERWERKVAGVAGTRRQLGVESAQAEGLVAWLLLSVCPWENCRFLNLSVPHL